MKASKSGGTVIKRGKAEKAFVHVRHEDAAGCFKCDPHAALHRRGGDGQRKDTASDGT